MSRRKALTGFAAGIAGALGLRGGAEGQVSQAYCGDVSCRTNPSKCKEGCVCCVWPNKNSRCMPPNRCDEMILCPPGKVADPIRGCVDPCTGTGTGNCLQPANPCQVATCAASGLCVVGAAPNNTSCGTNSICCSGTCRANNTATTCGTCGTTCSGSTPYCVGGTCVACRTPVDCPAATPGTCQGDRTCSAGVCGFAPATVGTTCRAATGPCDLPATCSGASTVCPPNGFRLNSFVCRPANGPCDVAENCTGSSAACPPDGVAGTNVVCRAADSTGCDVAENCDGVNKTCPSDTKKADNAACGSDQICCNGICCDDDIPFCGPGRVCVECLSAANCPQPTNQCEVATCSGNVCGFANKSNGTACNDNNACTQTDTCQAGVCTGSNPVVCPTPDQCHLPGTCDPATGVCSNPNKANGTACNDGNECTLTDTCQAGVCTGTNPVICPTPDQCHLPGTCNPMTGICSNPPKTDGTTCNDGDACTSNDVCMAGMCAGTLIQGCVPCTITADCANVPVGQCQEAICGDSGTCVVQNKANGVACEDGHFCTTGDTCQSGACVGGPAPDCSAFTNSCNTGVCNEDLNSCVAQPVTNGTTCNDGNFCTVDDVCTGGVCGGTPRDCSSLNSQCTLGVCNEDLDTCVAQPANIGQTCSDGNLCTTGETCQANGTCGGGTATVCTALDQCHIAGTCDPATGVCSNPNKTDGTACNDANACTQTDTCQAGICTGGNPVICTALDQCHDVGVCNTATGVCTNPNKSDGTTCDDGDACTQTDTCQAGACTGTNPVVCTALDQCHVAGTCDPATGVCSNPNAADGTACDDGDACTQTDTCQAGSCVGSNPVICNAPPTGDAQCYNLPGTCNPGSGTCSYTPKSNGTACNDGNACTQTDTCQAGFCVGGNPVTCVASDQCHVAGTCDPATGTCSNPIAPNGTTCNDGNACTQTDTCQAGTCTGTNPVVCTALDQCHVAGTCDPATGVCSNPNAPNGTVCDDGLFCTTGTTCTNGTCGGGTPTCSVAQCLTCNETSDMCVSTCTAGQTCSGGTCVNNCIVEGGSCATVACCGTLICNENSVCEVPCDPNNPTEGCLCGVNSGVCPDTAPCCKIAGGSTRRCSADQGSNCACTTDESCTSKPLGNKDHCCEGLCRSNPC